MSSVFKPIGTGYRTVVPLLPVGDVEKALSFYVKAFGAEELYRVREPVSDEPVYAEMRIGDAIIVVFDEFAATGRLPIASSLTSGAQLTIYVEDADASFSKAVREGAEPILAIGEVFWGDRWGMLIDPFGHTWGIATHIVSASEKESPPDPERPSVERRGYEKSMPSRAS
jgi:PhnB protein